MKTSKNGISKCCPLTQVFLILLSWIALMILLNFAVFETGAQEILVNPGSSQWLYRDGGPLVDDSWKEPDFDDSSWSIDTAPLGYGNGDEATVVSFGPNSTNKFITTYFRHWFEVIDPTIYGGIQIRLQRDDGAVVYLNGEEIIRDNLPAGDIDFDTRALSAVGGVAEKAYQNYILEETTLEVGLNLVAVEVHQVSPTSSDISFDLELVGEWVPLQVVPVFPENQATLDPLSIPITVAVTDPVAGESSLNVKFYSRLAGPAPGSDFWIIALPDTQYYTGTKNGGTLEMFIQQIEWIRAQQALRNIVFVTQLGDCVEKGDNGGDDIEWRHATNALYRLEIYISTVLNTGIPYCFAPGNHDLSGLSSNAPTSFFFNQYFGVDHFLGRDYYGGHYGTNNNNNFEFFSASGLDFIIVHLEYDTTPEPVLLEWADQLLKAHADRRAIIVSHYLMGNGNQAPFGAQGQAVYDALKNNPNLFLMLSGHVLGEGRRQDTFNGNTVNTVLADYQGRPNGGDGWLRILEFSPSNNVVRFRTYSPVLDQYETDADSEFTLDYDMRRGDAFSEVGQIAGVTSGNQASLALTNLTPGATYEWYVEVSDGSRTEISPVWSFTTGESLILPHDHSLVEVRTLDPIASEVGPCRGRFVVSRTGYTNTSLTVSMDIGGSAICGIDFDELDHTVVLPPGICSSEVVVMPRADGMVEGIEEVTIDLVKNDSYCVGTNASALMLIADRHTDTDGDGMTDAEEVLAGTDWTDPDSVLRIETMRMVEGQLELSWSSIEGVTYRVCGKSDLNDDAWTDLSEDVEGEDGTTPWNQPVDRKVGRMFYAIRVVTDL